MKPCPYCGAYIKKAAIKCRYCRRDLPENPPHISTTATVPVMERAVVADSQAQSKGDVCAACGRAPARVLHLRRNVGMLIARTWYSIDVSLCRDHGLPLALTWFTKTLFLGWWGVISVVVNVGAVVMDVVAIAQALRLRAPE
jgi:hypothetical protein